MGSRRVLAIVGPTGSGKTEVAAELARRCQGEIVSADSMQVYRGLDIGTAKPSPELRREIAHHVIDVVDPDDAMSAGRYATLARAAAEEIEARGHPVILCGGTGLYARAFAGGLISGVASDPALRAALEERETADLYRELGERDSETAERLAPADRVRILRALEVERLSGQPMSEQHAEHRFSDAPFEMVWLGLHLERDVLARRIADRVDAMFREGLVDEVRGLLAAGYAPALPSLQAIGYRQVGALLAGSLSEADARSEIATATRRYAKRQRTWFRAQAGLRWIEAASPERVVEAALATLSD